MNQILIHISEDIHEKKPVKVDIHYAYDHTTFMSNAAVFFFIDTMDVGFQHPSSEEDLIPPLELCIWTK